MPKISIIMPVYNAAKYLRACLDSVLAAARTLEKVGGERRSTADVEIICVDDGSTDGSLEILREYEREVEVESRGRREVEVESRSRREDGFDFRVIACEHTNAGRCRNVGIAESHGEYLLFLDADDLFAPELLETLYDAAKASNADVAICGHVDFNDGDDAKGLFAQTKTIAPKVYHEPSKNMDVFHWQGWPWDKLIARRIIDRHALSFQEQRTTNDVFFMMSALSVAETIVECPVPLMAHRRNIRGSLSATRDKSPRCFYDALVGYYDKMCTLGIFPGNENLLENFRVYSCDQSFYQLDTVVGSDAARTIFPLLKELCNRWNWCEVLDHGGKHPLLRQRCKSLMLTDDVVEAYKSDLVFLRECYRELDAIKQSHTYRFAQFLVRLIRRSRNFMKF